MIKIRANVIGIKKAIEVKPTIDKKELADDMYKKLLQSDIQKAETEVDDAETEDIEDEEELSEEDATQEIIQVIDADRKATEEIFDFLKEVLGLTSAQIKKAKKTVDEEELGSYVFYVIFRLRGASDEQYDSLITQAGENVDPKKE